MRKIYVLCSQNSFFLLFVFKKDLLQLSLNTQYVISAANSQQANMTHFLSSVATKVGHRSWSVSHIRFSA